MLSPYICSYDGYIDVDQIYEGGGSEDEEDESIDQQRDKRSQKQGSDVSGDGFFRKGKVCEGCGTELEYREEYESWYCPECRDYK